MNDRNALLAELRELYVPSTSSLPAIGWWLLLVLIVALIALFRWKKKRVKNPRWLKDARAEIAQMRSDISHEQVDNIVPQCSSLARRLALLVDENSEVASMIGDEWLSRLDNIVERPLFTEGPGHLLLDGPYKPEPTTEPATLVSLLESVDQLCLAVYRKWSGADS